MSPRKSIRREIDQSSTTNDFGLLTGQQQIVDSASALRPVSKLLATSIRPTPHNPRYKELCDAYIIQPQVENGSGRHAGSTHINKLSRRRATEWMARVKDGWLKTEAGQAWLAEEVKSGHSFNFDNPLEDEKTSIWRARFRRWQDRVTRMLLRQPPDVATAKRWSAITGKPVESFVREREPLEPEERKRVVTLLTMWAELFALSSNILKDGLIQPVKVRPVHNGFQIVGGERRYWGCCLASIDHVACVGNEIDDITALSQTIHENLDRSDISLQSQVRSMRLYVAAKVAEPCGPNNTKVKLSFFEDEFAGRSRSWSARWRVVCMLPEDCEVMKAIYAGVYSTINEIDVHARAYLKYLKVNPGAHVSDAGSDPDAAGNATASQGINSAKQSAPKAALPKKPEPPQPRAKVRLPGTEAGKRILIALKTTEGLDEASQTAIESALKGWPAAPEKQRKKYLEEVIELMAKGLDHFDDEVEN
jgi:hypothetical protein